MTAMSSYEIAFFQNFFGFLIMAPFMTRIQLWGTLSILSGGMWHLHAVRIVGAVLGVILWYLSLRYMPIAEAVALGFTGPIFTILGARFYLNERIGAVRFLGIGLSIFGAFMITRPDRVFTGNDAHSIGFYAIFPLLSAVSIAASKLMTRDLARVGYDAKTLASQLLFWMIPVSLFFAMWDWQLPLGFQWFWLILLGIFSAGAHYTTALAYKQAEVSFLMPFGFARFFFSMMVGFIAFAEWPDRFDFWIGLTIIFTSVFLLSFEDKKQHSPITKQGAK